MRSLFERDSYEHAFRPLIKDSSIYIDRLGKQRQKKNIIQTINICSNSSGTSIYVRRVTAEKRITTKRSERVSSNQDKPKHKNVEFETKPKRNANKNVAFKFLPPHTEDNLCSMSKSSNTKCQRSQTKEYERIWKHVDSENLIKVEPTRYYVMLPPIRKPSEEKSKNSDMCHVSNVDNRQKDNSKRCLISERPKFSKSSIATKCLEKPTDCDILFGHKKLTRPRSCCWNGSRIDWMLDLEHRQELRRKRQQLWKATIAEENNLDLCCFPFISNVFVWHF